MVKLYTGKLRKETQIQEGFISYLKSDKQVRKETSPEGTCSVCWGYQQYDVKIRAFLKDKQIDINNHNASYMIVQDFMKPRIDSVKFKEGVINDCPTCSGIK